MKTRSTLSFLSLSVLAFTLHGQITSPAPYCNAGFDDDPFPVDDVILGVTLGTLTNQSNAQYAAPHYVYYNNLAAPTLQAGSSYTLTARFDAAGGVGIGAWIDYNRNNTFEASEKILVTPAAGVNPGISTHSVSFTVPAGVTAGTTRLRLRIVEDDTYNMQHNYDILACNTGTTSTDVMDWGETEDYNVTLQTSRPTGLAEQTISGYSLRVYPNPSEQLISFRLNEDTDPASVCLRNLQGDALAITYSVSAGVVTADLSALAPGIYLLEVPAGGTILREKVIRR